VSLCTHMPHTCHTHATHKPHTCHTHATHMPHTCHTHATHMCERRGRRCTHVEQRGRRASRTWRTGAAHCTHMCEQRATRMCEQGGLPECAVCERPLQYTLFASESRLNALFASESPEHSICEVCVIFGRVAPECVAGSAFWARFGPL